MFAVNSHAAVTVDGIDTGNEWRKAEYIQLITEPKENNVGFAYAKALIDSEYEVHYLLFFSDSLSDNYDLAGAILKLDDLSVEVTRDGFIVNGDSDKYYVDAAMAVNDNDGASCEITVGVKRGLPEKISATVSFIDGNGNHSYHYPVSVTNELLSKTETDADDETEVRTTKPKTTKPKSTKVNTVKSSSTKPQKVTESKTQKKTSKGNSTVVYFYEKEVLISEVYISDNPENEIDFELQESTDFIDPDINNRFSVSDGLKIQKAVCICGGVLLIALGAWAGYSGKNKKTSVNDSSDDDNKDDKEK